MTPAGGEGRHGRLRQRLGTARQLRRGGPRLCRAGLLAGICGGLAASPASQEIGPRPIGLVARSEAAPRPASPAALEQEIARLRKAGARAHSLAVPWGLCQPGPDRFDWAVCDKVAVSLRRCGLRWAPVLVVGGPGAVPPWAAEAAGTQRRVCLEHGRASAVASPWNPPLLGRAGRFVEAFLERYGHDPLLESATLDLGSQPDSVLDGSHAHRGVWAGDPHAIRSFRIWLILRYGGSGPFRDAWGERPGGLVHARPVLRRHAPTQRAWLDVAAWLAESRAEWARLLLARARKWWRGPLFLRMAGTGLAEDEEDPFLLARAAADHGAGLEARQDSRTPFGLVEWTASAAAQAGAAFRLAVTEARGPAWFAAASLGARDLVVDAARLRAAVPALPAASAAPLEIAVHLPSTHVRLNTFDLARLLQPLRRCFPFRLLDDAQVTAGGLREARALVLVHGAVAESRTWSAVARWVRAGGLLVRAEEMGPLVTPEGDGAHHAALFHASGGAGRGRVVSIPEAGRSIDFRRAVCRVLRDAPELSPGTRALIDSEGGLLCAPLAEGGMLWLNPGPVPVRRGEAVIPAGGIRLRSRGGLDEDRRLATDGRTPLPSHTDQRP